MINSEIKKAQTQSIDAMIEYVTNTIVIRSIINKPTGIINAIAFDSGEILAGAISPFDTFVQILEGKAEIIIDDSSNLLNTGQAIIIPAHSRSMRKARERFKMLSTTIKSGYEEVG